MRRRLERGVVTMNHQTRRERGKAAVKEGKYHRK